MAPPSFAEYGNYLAETASAEQAYLATPGHNLVRGVAGGGVMLATVLLGMILSLHGFGRADSARRQTLGLLWLATLAQVGAQVALLALTWQRYVVPLIPLACLWAAYALAPVLVTLTRHTKPNHKRTQPDQLA
jgi:hypothetical protein